ncbi:MAG: TIGR00268 family protein, partial [Oscillospiraceae bacterium]|nr:TIGR00268 family protein [Oscillospiraceae bacterium]
MTLEQYFQTVPKAAAAFSGGTDSAYLLWAAKEAGC